MIAIQNGLPTHFGKIAGDAQHIRQSKRILPSHF
jgi:hypothetical protein